MVSPSLTLVSKSTTASPGPVPEAVAYKLPNMSTGNCGTPGPTRAEGRQLTSSFPRWLSGSLWTAHMGRLAICVWLNHR